MRYLTILSLIIVLSCTPSSQKQETNNKETSIQTIAFGSCSKQNKVEDQLWKEVVAENPDLWIWLGDNIYADTEDMQKMKADYDLQKSHPDYQALLNQTNIIGTWDDHDFGGNDMGKEYPMKEESRDLLFDFLDVDKDNKAWKRKGAYQAYDYNSEGKKLKIVLLDVRYYRDSLTWSEDPKIAQVNEDGDILGDEQWNWLETQLSDDADFILIASGIQVLAKDHTFEKWANFPKAKARLFDLIAEKVKIPLAFLSGDRHISEVSKIELKGYEFPLYDFTSSSLTTPWSEPSEDPNELRIGSTIYPANFALLKINWSTPKLSLQLKFVGEKSNILSEHSIQY